MNSEKLSRVKILDCTLRDGGYVNDWEFGHSVISGTYKRLDNAGVDFIEVGFLDDRREFDFNRTIMPNTASLNKVYENITCKNAIPVAMIDFGTCDINNVADAKDSFVKGIRVIFKKEKIAEALPFCKAIKDKGYMLFIQAISITAYSDEEMIDYVGKINEINPYAFSIVDTYGLLDNEKLEHYFHLIDDNLNENICMGYHSHNNFQLAFSNTITFFKLYNGKRELVADSSVYGMGKSAGNCATELLAMHMNTNYGKNYDLSMILEIIDADLMAIYNKHYWGYKYIFYIAAMQNCHPSYVSYLLNKKTLSVTAINSILTDIPEDIKLLFNEDYIVKAYTDYQQNEIDDSEEYKNLADLCNKEILLIGPGSTVVSEKEKINQFISKNNPVVIAINYIPDDFSVEYVFVSNAKRYSQFADMVQSHNRPKLIATSNITTVDYPINYHLNYESLLMSDLNGYDNALSLILNALTKLGVNKVNLAGFDGYSSQKENYFRSAYEYSVDKEDENQMNRKITLSLKKISEKMSLNFVTTTLYDLKD